MLKEFGDNIGNIDKVDYKMNTCGDCTLCCTLLPVPELDKPANTHCQHCIVGKGCSIYEDRPQVCRPFNCAWLQSSASIDLRPDKINIIFEKVNDNIFFGTQELDIKPTELALKQTQQFRVQGFSVVINENDTLTVIPSNGRTKEDVKTEFLEATGRSE